MVRGIYSAAAGMITQYKKLDVIGNNISNVNTSGFKQSGITLTDEGKENISSTSDGKNVGSLPFCVVLNKETTDFTDGALKETNIGTNFAIDGNGFFAVESAAGGGVKYTRDGEFSVDSQGYLALSTGERLLSQNGSALYVGSSNFTVSTDGTVTRANGTKDKIQLYTARSQQNITSRKDGFYNITGAVAANGQIEQGYLEESNTDVIDNMTNMIASNRSFQGCQQAFQVSYQTLDKLVNQVGTGK